VTAVRADHSYPGDEFDDPSANRPVGAHRAARSRWRSVLPFLVVLVLFPLLAFGIVTWLVDSDALPSVGAGDATQEPSDTSTGEQGSGDDGERDAGDDAGGAGVDQEEPGEVTGEVTGAAGIGEDGLTGTSAPEPQSTPPAEPDTDRPVTVLNATNRTGLAAGASGEVEGAGFTTVSFGNWPDQDPPASVVRYSVEADADTAEAVSAVLGIDTVELVEPGERDGIVVILAGDYEG
jgi:hypothetical protein